MLDDTDVRTALTAHVTEAEPAIGLTATNIMTAGRRMRHRRLAGGTTGVALAVAGLLTAATLTSGSPPDELAAGSLTACPKPAPNETYAQTSARLGCLVGGAVRAELPRGSRLDRLPTTLPGHVVYRGEGLTGFDVADLGAATTFSSLQLRTSDAKGSGDLLLNVDEGLLPASLTQVAHTCESHANSSNLPNLAVRESCMVRPYGKGFLLTTTWRLGAARQYEAQYVSGSASVSAVATNGGGGLLTLPQKETGQPPAVHRDLPPLSTDQLDRIVTTPGVLR